MHHFLVITIIHSSLWVFKSIHTAVSPRAPPIHQLNGEMDFTLEDLPSAARDSWTVHVSAFSSESRLNLDVWFNFQYTAGET